MGGLNWPAGPQIEGVVRLDWVLLALLSAFLFGLVTALEKRLIDYHFPNLSVYFASISIALIIPAVVVFQNTAPV